LPITADNFKVAWGTICNRYDNPKLIATAHVKALFSLPSVSKDSVADLRDLLNQLGSNLNAIEALDLETPLHEVLLSQLVLERIDEHSRKEWEVRTSSQQFARLAELCEFLENRCRALELIKSTQSSKGTSSVNKHHDNSKQSKHAK
jgi:hypothetical protein